MKECFKKTKFSSESQTRIDEANDIIYSYSRQGLRLTLRQLYYQFVSKALIPNEEKSYKNLGSIISKGRLAGLIDWDAIEDRMRQPQMPPQFPNIRTLVEGALGAYRLPRRKGQEFYVELWVEKDALAGVLAPIARKFHITLMVNRGYSSSSAMYESAKRIEGEMAEDGSECAIIFYLGDLDPSGEDMVRDIQDRLSMFGSYAEVRKLALTMDQVQQYNPPPNPTKLSDSRAKAFVEKYGHSSWEVDALPPTALRDIIEDVLEIHTDQELVDRVIEKENEDKKLLRDAVKDVKG